MADAKQALINHQDQGRSTMTMDRTPEEEKAAEQAADKAADLAADIAADERMDADEDESQDWPEDGLYTAAQIREGIRNGDIGEAENFFYCDDDDPMTAEEIVAADERGDLAARVEEGDFDGMTGEELHRAVIAWADQRLAEMGRLKAQTQIMLQHVDVSYDDHELMAALARHIARQEKVMRRLRGRFTMHAVPNDPEGAA